MLALAMSRTAMRPSRSFSPSTMQSVPVFSSRMRFQAVSRLVSASMPGWREIWMSLICGVTVVMRGGSSNPKWRRTKAVSRLMAPARRAS